jgi:hypothetical protein
MRSAFRSDRRLRSAVRRVLRGGMLGGPVELSVRNRGLCRGYQVLLLKLPAGRQIRSKPSSEVVTETENQEIRRCLRAPWRGP